MCGTQHRHPIITTDNTLTAATTVRPWPAYTRTNALPPRDVRRTTQQSSARPAITGPTSQRTPQQEPLEYRTPRAGDRLDATGQALRVGDEVSFLATQYTTGGTAIIRRFTATFAILRRSNGGEVRRAPSNVTRLLPPHH